MRKIDYTHIQEIIDVLSEKKLFFSINKTVRIFESMNLGTYTSKCIIKSNSKAGYNYLIYKGRGQTH